MTCLYAARFLATTRRVICLALGASACILASASVASAQAKETEDEPKTLEPENITLKVNDGRNGRLVIHATYFPSNLGKEAVPVVMLHDYKGNRHDYDTLARTLQERKGHAVIVPDLRGHGDSTQYMLPENAPPTYRQKTLDKQRMNKADFARIVTGDLEAVRGFLVRENNQAKLNLNKLCVVGAGMGTVMALNWALVDWTAPVLAVGKQGQDIKGLVLISPQWNFRGLPIQSAIKNQRVRSKISILFIYGEKNSRSKSDAMRLFKHFKPHHPDGDVPAKRELFDFGLETPLQGTDVLKQPALPAPAAVASFIDRRLVSKDFEWTDRTVLGN